jgi:putative zinc finger protein
MKTEGCRAWRERIGALALGQLEPAERAATDAHLEGCRACQADAEALAAVATLLSRADPERLTPTPAPPARLGDRIARRIAAERRTARRRRVRLGLAIGGATAAVAAALVVAVVLDGSSSPARSQAVAFRGLPAGVSAHASLEPRPWGSDVAVRVRGFRPGTLCTVWLRRANGTRIPAGSFRYVYDGDSDEAELSSALPPGDATAVGLRAGDRTFVAPLPARPTRPGAALNPTRVRESS